MDRGQRKRSPLTLKNCVPELPTFGAIAGFNLSGVQWKGLDLGRSPFFIMVLPVPCKYDSYSEGRLRTKFYDDFNFPIVNFPFICSNIPVAYGAHISQLIRQFRACGSCQDFLDRGLLLTRKPMNQGFFLVKVKSSPRKFYGRHHYLVDRYGISVSQMTTDMFHLW